MSDYFRCKYIVQQRSAKLNAARCIDCELRAFLEHVFSRLLVRASCMYLSNQGKSGKGHTCKTSMDHIAKGSYEVQVEEIREVMMRCYLIKMSV